MLKLIKEYDAKIDSKKRMTLKDVDYNYYHIEMYDDGSLKLFPRVLIEPKSISKKTLKMMDKSIANIKNGKVSKAIDIKNL